MTGAILSITPCAASLQCRFSLSCSFGADMQDDDIDPPPEKMDALEIVVLVLCAFVGLFFFASIYF
jgi:hypothetical protein